MADIRMRVVKLSEELSAAGAPRGVFGERASEIVEALRDASKALARAEMDRMLMQVKDEQIARQVEMLEAVGHPLLQVRSGVLCAPVIGPIDYERARKLMDVALHGAVEQSARHVVVDLTGAVVADPAVVRCLADVARALSMVGVGVSLSGIRASLAQLWAQDSTALAGISTFSTLSAALGAIREHMA